MCVCDSSGSCGKLQQAFIDPGDHEYKETLKHARRKLERLVDAAMPCTKKIHTSNRKLASEVTASHKVPKTIHGCFVESHESTRQRVEPSLPRKHEDHIAGEGFSSMSHYNLAHQFIPMRQAMKIRDAEAAGDKELKTRETIWQLDKIKSKKEVTLPPET